MFENDPRNMKLALREMARAAYDANLGSGNDPARKLAEYLQQDARFRDFDPSKLAHEVMQRARSGTTQGIDLEDPVLRGGPPRPLSR
jgi:hypothetical protein